MLCFRLLSSIVFAVQACSTVSTCDLNPCLVPNYCNGKSCVITESCTVYCECDELSTAPECQNTTTTTTSASPNVSLPPWDDGCQCVHGQCVTGSDNLTKCTCDTGWAGSLCDFNCSCPESMHCVLIDQSGFSICQFITTPKTETTVTTLTPSTDHSFNRTYNVCDPDYTLRYKSERECFGFKCVYGTCHMNDSRVYCECDPGATGQVCQHKCCRQCEHGSCYYYLEEEREICNCEVNYTGLYCEIWDPPKTYTPPKEVTWHYWVVGACVLVLLILLILMVAVPYIMWKNRVILVMKVVHYFQGYEDDDERQWDAFISYKSTTADETYVVKTLFPKLEKELGFKVNVHFRDFSPGETIANNIIKAVQCSRRTIMIITPSYVTSEFTKFEYEVAQQEMLKRKHRIIPILLEDITECKDTMDPNLKLILNSVTYIEWPKESDQKKLDKFWKRIELSMPKIKNRSSDENMKASGNGQVTMTKPEDINMSFTTKDKVKSNGNIPNGNTNIYNIIDEMKLSPDEVYNELNESEMQSKVFIRDQEPNGNPEQSNSLNGLKIDI